MDIAIFESGVLLMVRFIYFRQDKIQYDTHKSTVSCVRTSLKFCRGKIPKYRNISIVYACTGREGGSFNECTFAYSEGGRVKICDFFCVRN